MHIQKIFSILFLAAVSTINAQVAIGKETISSPSVSLEFGAGNKGIILPYILDASTMQGVVPGTMIIDAKTGVIQYATSATKWTALSFSGLNTSYDNVTQDITGKVNTLIQSALVDLPSATTIIGTARENIAGVLVLSDNDKAMVLPKMESPHLNIKNPAPGMIAYDTLKKQLAVFNGTVWTFWKP